MHLHDGEYHIDDALVGDLLEEQMAEWANLPLRRLDTSGTVNVAYRLGDDMLVRLPRAPDFAGGPERQARWMPVFASAVPLQVPEYLALGAPTGRFPSHWSVLRWIEGADADTTTLTDLNATANALGEFVVALRNVSTGGGPKGGSYRGFGLAGVDRDLRRWADQLPDDIDQCSVLRVWESCLAAEEWAGPPTWFHGDLRSGNLIARDGELVAVIDWEGCTVGDPSSDLLPAWWIFEGESRETFRTATQAEAADWSRGMGWALHMATAAIPYYEHSNPVFVNHARRALNEILNSG